MQQRFRLSRVVVWRVFPLYSPSCTALALLDMLSCVVAAAHVCLIVLNMQDTIGQIRSCIFNAPSYELWTGQYDQQHFMIIAIRRRGVIEM